MAITTGIFKGVYLTDLSEFHIDISNFVSEVANGNKDNNGLIVLADLLGDDNLRLPSNIGNAIRNTATVRIVFK